MRRLKIVQTGDEQAAIKHDCMRLFLAVVSLKLHFVDQHTAIQLGIFAGYQHADVLQTIDYLLSNGIYVAIELELPTRDSIVHMARSLNSELTVENAISSLQSLNDAPKCTVRMIGPSRVLAGCIGMEMPYRITRSYLNCCYRQSVILSGLASQGKEWQKKWKNRLTLRPYPSAKVAKWAETPMLFLVSFRRRNIRKWMNHLQRGGSPYVVC
ncbi:MAG: hypothetical protein J0M26_06370 [Planctomycetes bacterium]|nr:hypothetical protein [Planctomycetota bacterium]